MGTNKSIPLVGRLAIQLKMLTSAEVKRAMSEGACSGNPRLSQVFLQMGLLDRDQLAKLQKVQKDLVEKHRAKKNGAAPAAERPAPAAAQASPPTKEVDDAAMHAAQAASPVTAFQVEALHEAPPVARAKPAPEPVAAESLAAPQPVAATPEPAAETPPPSKKP